MSGGYVYVIAFDNGVIKVGRSEKVTKRLKSHEAMARSFGIAVTAQWGSPEHDGWVENERELMRLARELGGVPITDEYFTGVSFDVLAASAAELAFPPPRPEAPTPPQVPIRKNLRKMPQWLASDFAETSGRVYWERCTVDEALEHLADRVLGAPDIMRLLAKQYASRRLKNILNRGTGDEVQRAHVTPEPPEPPEPQPPLAFGPRHGGHLRLIVTEALTDLAAQAA
jgi:hypothetical protein